MALSATAFAIQAGSLPVGVAVPRRLHENVAQCGHQKALPAIARDPELSTLAEQAAQRLRTHHCGILGDSRTLPQIDSDSVHLVVTSPPYWNLKPYERGERQLGLIDDFDEFVSQLDRVWNQCMRVLVPGGRLVIVTGDVLLPRRRLGRHLVFPLHAAIQEHTRQIGFDNLAPIVWHKIGNAALEVENGGRFWANHMSRTESSRTTSSTFCSSGNPAVTVVRRWTRVFCR